jgi:hypothetical protein
MEAHRGSRVTILSLNSWARKDVGGQSHTPATLPLGNNPVPLVQEAGYASGRVWAAIGKRKYFAATGVLTAVLNTLEIVKGIFVLFVISDILFVKMNWLFVSTSIGISTTRIISRFRGQCRSKPGLK